jgi:hypothetical protein
VTARLLLPIHTWNNRRALRAARRSADEQLLASRIASPRLAWRTAELVAAEHRVEIGRSLTEAVHAADERFLPSASPLDRLAVRECRAQLLELASRFFDFDRPVSPRGVLLAERLLASSAGPLYGHGDPRRLRLELRRIASTLDGGDE